VPSLSKDQIRAHLLIRGIDEYSLISKKEVQNLFSTILCGDRFEIVKKIDRLKVN